MKDTLLQSFIDEDDAWKNQVKNMYLVPTSSIIQRLDYKASYIENFLLSLTCLGVREARKEFERQMSLNEFILY